MNESMNQSMNQSINLLFYTTCIRPVLQYARPVFHHSLPQYLSNEMERLQKRALQIIQPDLSYAEALVALDITSLYERRKALSWGGGGGEGSYFSYIPLNEIQTMFLQLAKRSAKVLASGFVY